LVEVRFLRDQDITLCLAVFPLAQAPGRR
jgi:hypothetical protein